MRVIGQKEKEDIILSIEKKKNDTTGIQKSINMPMPILESPKDPNFASEFHSRLIEWINDFHRDLDDKHEAGVQLVTFGEKVTFHIQNIGYWNPSLISFAGITDNNEPVELIQHVSQISILLMKMKKINPDKPKKPIGFATWEMYDKDLKSRE